MCQGEASWPAAGTQRAVVQRMTSPRERPPSAHSSIYSPASHTTTYEHSPRCPSSSCTLPNIPSSRDTSCKPNGLPATRQTTCACAVQSACQTAHIKSVRFCWSVHQR